MSEFTLVIGNKNYSSWSLRPWLWMKHHGLDFDEIPIALFTESMENDLAAYFSNNKVPVLLHGGHQVWDSLAILEYLADHVGETSRPAHPRARGVMRSLCAEMHSSFVSLRSELPMNCRREPSALDVSAECRTDIDRIQSLWRYAQRYSDNSDHWLFGAFSAADAMYAPVALRFDRYQVALEDEARDYVERLLAHPAMLEWVEAGRAETQVIEEEER